MTRIGVLERLDGELASVPDALAVGWATVDLERATVELADALGIEADRFQTAPDSQALGARCLVAHDVLRDGRPLAILEPATEGRLAASLARLGEGPAAIWIVASTSSRLGAPTDGPFGPERLVLDGPAHGPHRLLVGSPGTIHV